jgi:sterol desaturase/sphingolipid hydroxylase (fatty acid hydroxylase superfamily)
MQTWLDSILHYGQLSQLRGRWEHELLLFLPIPLLFLLELAVTGWKGSSVAALGKPGRSGRWEIAFLVLQVTGARKFLSNLCFFGLIAYIGFAMGDYTLGLLKGYSAWVQVPAAMFLYDFLHYWNHRIRHTSLWIWQVHEFHHSSTTVNLFTSYRVHPLDNFIRVVTIAIPFQILLGLDLENTLVITILSSLPGIYAHARIDYDFGWLGRYVFVTPRFHQLHHAITLNRHANYGHAFVFWDRLFGTYIAPEAPIAQIQQGIEDNFYERESPLKAMLKPIWRFYAYPFRWAKAGVTRISPAQSSGR